jgi:NAD(P)-dependent dehydrogenase (short-subunit alcohol dehydrogenase family)
MTKSLHDKVAIVTGAATGIGSATAKRLAADGVAVGGTASQAHTDVSDERSVVQLFADTVARYGGVDIVHNNAAAVGADVHGRDVAIADGKVEVWDRTLAVNLRGVMLGCKHAIPLMLERGGGVIINTSSTSALGGGPSAVAYAASKSAIVAVTQHVAARYGKEGIRCVAIAPGLIVTEDVEKNISSSWRHIMLRQQCTQHVGRPDDIANAVAFLVSDQAEFITGVLIPVDGGQMCHRPSLADELEGMLGSEPMRRSDS